MAKKSTTYKGAPKPFGQGGFFHEPRRHALNRAGIRTGNLARPIRLPDTDKDGVPDKFDCKPLDPTKQDFEQTIVEDFKKEFGLEVNEEDISEVDDYYMVEVDGEEWMVFESYDDAEDYAREMLEQDMYDNPEMFGSDFLSNHLSVTDTDKRVVADEEADFRIGDMSDDDLLREAELDDEYDELDEKYSEIEDEVDRRTGETKSDAEIQDWLDEQEEKMDEIEKKKEALVDKAKDEVHDQIYNEWYEGLDDDPIGFLVNDMGMYSESDLMEGIMNGKISFISIDVDDAIDEIIRMDGLGHVLSSYDGNEFELPSGAVAFRTN